MVAKVERFLEWYAEMVPVQESVRNGTSLEMESVQKWYQFGISSEMVPVFLLIMVPGMVPVFGNPVQIYNA